jgi:hypothetical protein
MAVKYILYCTRTFFFEYCVACVIDTEFCNSLHVSVNNFQCNEECRTRTYLADENLKGFMQITTESKLYIERLLQQRQRQKSH